MKYLSYFPLIIIFYLCSCKQSQQATTDQLAVGSYILDCNCDSWIKPEYNLYLFKQGERRRVYVYGKRPFENYNCVWAYYDYQGSRIEEDCFQFNQATNDDNMYWNPSSTNYTCYLNISPVNNIQVNATIGTEKRESSASGTQIVYKVIENREFAIKYGYATSYDIFQYGKDLLNDIKRCFKPAGTDINMDPTKPCYNNLQEYLDFDVDVDPYYRQQFIDYYLNHSEHSTASDLHWGYLYSLKNIHFRHQDYTKVDNPPSEFKGMLGNSIGLASFVFIDSIQKYNTYISDEGLYYFNSVVLHELGHLREGDRGGVDISHNNHNGTDKTQCIMLKSPTKESIKRRSFCEGHIQFLLNQDW